MVTDALPLYCSGLCFFGLSEGATRLPMHLEEALASASSTGSKFGSVVVVPPGKGTRQIGDGNSFW